MENNIYFVYARCTGKYDGCFQVSDPKTTCELFKDYSCVLKHLIQLKINYILGIFYILL